MKTFIIEYFVNNEKNVMYVKEETALRARTAFIRKMMSKYGATYLNAAGFHIIDVL